MPFDSTDFPTQPPTPATPKRVSDNEASALIIILFAIMVLTPISAGALIDIVHVFKH